MGMQGRSALTSLMYTFCLLENSTTKLAPVLSHTPQWQGMKPVLRPSREAGLNSGFQVTCGARERAAVDGLGHVVERVSG